jgi:hypothetical protein
MRKNKIGLVYMLYYWWEGGLDGVGEAEICAGVKGNMGGIKEVMDGGGREEGLNGCARASERWS